jgi:phage terminase large subunit GpA-like protein
LSAANRSSAHAWFLQALADAVRPRPKLGIAAWSEANIVISAESNSPRTGPLSFKGVEYVLEVLARLSPDDRCRSVNVLGSAQSAKSLIGQCWLAFSMAENPGPIGIYLPSLDDARKYSEEKVGAITDSTPALRHRVRAVSSRSNEGSSTLRKRFTGGSLRIATASSPNALQMVSFRDLILEEIAGYETDVGGRGSPIDQAKKRQGAWETRGAKTLQVSAAGVLGRCPSTKAHEDGTAHELYLPCPHCGGFNRWEWEDFNAPTATLGAHIACRLCGCVVEHKHKQAMVEAHAWIATYEDREDPANTAPPRAFPAAELERWRARPEKKRMPSYRWWLYVSCFTEWDEIWAEWVKAKAGGIATEKTFFQQTLARAWDEGKDAPDHVKLFEMREEYEPQICPDGFYLLTGMADVQADHIPWSVYAWAPGAEWALVDRGKIRGDPAGEEVWKELAQVLSQRYPHAGGGELGIELFGVDTGYKTHHVYAFCAKHPTARALDGRAGWNLQPLGNPKKVKAKLDGRLVAKTLLYPTGTWNLKSELHYSLRLMIEKGAGYRCGGRGHFHKAIDQDYVRELVAEVLTEETARGKITRAWMKRAGFRNEETDIWVGARALAWALGVGAPRREFDWDKAREDICGESQRDLFAAKRMHPESEDGAPLNALTAATAPAPPPADRGWKPKHTFAKGA